MYRKFDFKNMTPETAEAEIFNLQGTTYGHNMISLILNHINKKYGEEAVDKIVRNTELYGGI